MDALKRDSLRRFAADIRIKTLDAICAFGSGHVGGSMSSADVLAALYGGILRVDPQNPQAPDRDLFVMSKGHCGPALYAALALKGFFPIEWLKTLNQPGTRLPSHCDRLKTPGIDATTGSLGQGVSIACGLALGSRLDGKDNFTYVLLGDGELQEGQVWEAAAFAAQQKLSHMVWLIDVNKMQLDGYTEEICASRDLAGKFASFGFRTAEVDGHDVGAVYEILEKREESDTPLALLLHTRKGGGCVFAEEAALCHHMTVSEADRDRAVAEIERRYSAGLHPLGGAYDR